MRVGILEICVTSSILRVLLSGFWVSGSQFPSSRDPFPGSWVSGFQGPGPQGPGSQVLGVPGHRIMGSQVSGSLVPGLRSWFYTMLFHVAIFMVRGILLGKSFWVVNTWRDPVRKRLKRSTLNFARLFLIDY